MFSKFSLKVPHYGFKVVNFPTRVEESVEERVAAGGEHGNHVEGEEKDVVVGPTRQRNLTISM